MTNDDYLGGTSDTSHIHTSTTRTYCLGDEYRKENEDVQLITDREILFEKLGAFVGLCFSEYGGWGMCIKYWVVRQFKDWILPEIIILKQLGKWSGFIDMSRGLHWNR